MEDISIGEILLTLLTKEKGLILGEIAEALGRLKYIKSYEILLKMSNDSTSPITEKVIWAIKQLKK